MAYFGEGTAVVMVRKLMDADLRGTGVTGYDPTVLVCGVWEVFSISIGCPEQ